MQNATAQVCSAPLRAHFVLPHTTLDPSTPFHAGPQLTHTRFLAEPHSTHCASLPYPPPQLGEHGGAFVPVSSGGFGSSGAKGLPPAAWVALPADEAGASQKGGGAKGKGRQGGGERGRGNGDRGRGDCDRGRGSGESGPVGGERGRGGGERGRGGGERGRGGGRRGRGGGAAPQDEQDQPKDIFLLNVPYAATEQELASHLETVAKSGGVEGVRLLYSQVLGPAASETSGFASALYFPVFMLAIS